MNKWSFRTYYLQVHQVLWMFSIKKNPVQITKDHQIISFLCFSNVITTCFHFRLMSFIRSNTKKNPLINSISMTNHELKYFIYTNLSIFFNTLKITMFIFLFICLNHNFNSCSSTAATEIPKRKFNSV